MLEPTAPDRQTPSIQCGKNALAGDRLTSVGLRPPSVSRPPAHSHLDCRCSLTLIVARQETAIAGRDCASETLMREADRLLKRE